MNIDYLPIDIMLEIFSRLPGKSIGRCRCVSKQWRWMLGRKDFREILLTKSSTRPRLVFAIEIGIIGEEVILFSTSQLQNPYNKSSSSLEVVVADFDIVISKKMWRMECSYASGLMYLPNVLVTNENKDKINVICNPSTGRYVKLPEIGHKDTYLCNFLGFDPIDNQFKVLYCFDNCGPEIVTLGTRKMRWRKVHCPLKHRPTSPAGICINGVLYYSFRAVESKDEMIVCFDVRSEKFKFIEGKSIPSWIDNKLINYKGRLGVINYWMREFFSGVLCLWVLEDVEIQKWSKYVFHIPEINNETDWPRHVPIVGMTATNDIILLDDRKLASLRLLHVFYYNPDMNTFQHVRIHIDFLPFEKTNYGVFAAFVDHVEDFCSELILKTMSTCDHHHATSTTSSSTKDRRRGMFESINKFDALRLLLGDDDNDDDQFTGV